MSSTIWTRCGGKSNLARLTQTAHRIVEDQSKIATRKLVDSLEEQERLETLIESVKPPLPLGHDWNHVHYLLFTPFRYPPLTHGSRFGTRHERGLWYGSVHVHTALAEVAFWRLRLLNGTAAVLNSEVMFTAFSIKLSSPHAIDLTVAPFTKYKDRISSPLSYIDSQPLGTDMRRDGVAFCRYGSARDPQGGANVVVFSPTAFASKRVSESSQESWYCHATRTEVEFRRHALTDDARLHFRRSDFEIAGHLPLMKD